MLSSARTARRPRMRWTRKVRSTVTPSRVEVNLRAIPVLEPGGWRLCTLEEVPLTGTVPKNYLAFGDPFGPETVGYIAKKKKSKGPSELDCVTEEIISSIGRLLPIEIAKSRCVRLPSLTPGGPVDVRFMSRNFLRRGDEQLLHGLELVANYLDSNAAEVTEVFHLEEKREERRFYTVDQMLLVLKWWGRTEVERRSLCNSFGRMLAFDALVGAQDRHAMNWGGIECIKDPDAPSLLRCLTLPGVCSENTARPVLRRPTRRGSTPGSSTNTRSGQSLFSACLVPAAIWSTILS